MTKVKYEERQQMRWELYLIKDMKASVAQMQILYKRKMEEYHKAMEEYEIARKLYDGTMATIRNLPENDVTRDTLLKASLYQHSTALHLYSVSENLNQIAENYDSTITKIKLQMQSYAKLINMLRPIERTVLMLKYFEQLTHFQIAIKLNYSKQTIDYHEQMGIKELCALKKKKK